jgi:hypothetical protein
MERRMAGENETPGIEALRDSIERLTTQVERLANLLQNRSMAAETQSQSKLQELIDRPEVEPEDRNTASDVPPDEEGDDAARV